MAFASADRQIVGRPSPYVQPDGTGVDQLLRQVLQVSLAPDLSLPERNFGQVGLPEIQATEGA